MKKGALLFFTVLFASALCHAQISTPQIRKFNAGLFMGLGGQAGPNLNFLPSLNLSYKTTTLTAGVSLNNDVTVGLIHEIMPLSVAFYNVRWIASGFYSTGSSDRYYQEKSSYQGGALLTGLKFYFAKRCFSNAQLGMAYNNYHTPGRPTVDEWMPFFEFGLGIQLFKSFYPKKEDTVE